MSSPHSTITASAGDNADLEKQQSHTSASAENDPTEDEIRDGYAGEAADGTTVEIIGHKQERSTTFDEAVAQQARNAGTLGTKATRTFSRRDDHLLTHQDSHIFGGDLQRQHTEHNLSRFASQHGKDTVTVHWEGPDDPENPQTWSKLYRWYLTALAGLLVLNSTFTSSAPSGVLTSMIPYFGISQEVAILIIALFVAGYCLGPLIWGPLSERIGRRPVFLIALFIYTAFNVGCALSKNTASILVFRFLAGAFAASPLTNSGGVIADIWDAKTRGDAMAIFSIAPFAGPALGPIVGGFIQVTGTDWRWLFWVCTIFSGFCLILTAATLPETYAPILLKRKAAKIRKETGDNRYKAPMDMVKLQPAQLLHATFAKPFIMMAQEPMLLIITLYMSFVYGIVYLLFEAYPIVFEEGHGFNTGVSGLMFIPFFLGGVVAVVIYILFINPRYAKKVDALEKGQRVPPEERLVLAMIAAPSLVIALFWFGWTSNPKISFWSPMLAGSLLGFAILFIFLSLFNYIVDAYLANAASALSGNTVFRSSFGAGFPLFATQMYTKLGTEWASSLLGFLAIAFLPAPFLLYKFGGRIRAWSKNAVA